MSRIDIVKGDIFAQQVDAIVNPANEDMAHGGGLAAIIATRAGERLISQSDAMAPVPTGQAITTTAGDLPFKAVIHTVGPRWQGGVGDEEKLLAEAHFSALDQLSRCALDSVAFPAISCGIFGYPVDKAAPVAVGAVRQFMSNHPYIKRVVFCLPTDDHYRAFAAANRPPWLAALVRLVGR